VQCRPPGAWTIGRPTLHGGTVVLRPVRATPCLLQNRTKVQRELETSRPNYKKTTKQQQQQTTNRPTTSKRLHQQIIKILLQIKSTKKHHRGRRDPNSEAQVKQTRH